MDRSGTPAAAWFLCMVYIFLYLNNCVDPNLSDGIKSLVMMVCSAHNDINILWNFYLYDLFAIFLTPHTNPPLVNQTHMNAQFDGVDESIRAKMCHQLIDDNSGKIVYIYICYLFNNQTWKYKSTSWSYQAVTQGWYH